MCELASFIYKAQPNGVDVLLADMESHSDTYKAYPGKNEQTKYYEGHYKPNGDIELRTPSGRDKISEGFLREKYPTFDDFIWGMFVAGLLPYSENTEITRVLQGHGALQ